MKNLIFIPYQDIYDFTNSGILTREYSILYFLKNNGIENIYSVSKPRTALDKKELKDIKFPNNSVEAEVYQVIKNSKKFRYETILNTSLFLKKREWWIEGYKKNITDISKKDIDYNNTIVYSNNPFAYEMLDFMKLKGATIYFDMMDNLVLHPSLNNREQNAAKRCYEKVLEIADFVSCNSKAILKFSEENFNKQPILIKNGVFSHKPNLEILDEKIVKKTNELLTLKSKYKIVAGYIGKLGLRLDERLIENIVKENPEVLFIFIGPHLKGQRNKELEKVFEKYENIISFGSIPSSYINYFLNQFSMFLIPHAVGKYENGGDPLKLYQYLNIGKPVISTRIEGVDEFEDIITISNDESKWNEFIRNVGLKVIDDYEIPASIFWEKRLLPLLEFLKNKGDNSEW